MSTHCPVIVRMYRGILGDCFLLRIGPERARSHILIDCGVLQGVEKGRTRMRAIVENIAVTTGGIIECLIVTHEHFDHISGFQYAEDLFAKMTIKSLWLAWTEDPNDGLGVELQSRFAAAHRKLAALQLRMTPEPARDVQQRTSSPPVSTSDLDQDEKRILGLAGFRFDGPQDHDGRALAAKGGSRGSKAIYEKLREWVKKEDSARKPDYLSPGDVLPTPGAAQLTAYVLGPPREEKFLFKALPSAGEAKETYLASPTGADMASTGSPFAPRYRWATPDQLIGDGPGEKFVREAYLADHAPCRYAGGTVPKGHACEVDFLCLRYQAYRRIDDTTRLAESALALKMDSNTNNSSLVIAFELPSEGGGRSTMIFAADAQVGNWLSWEKVEFRDRKTREKLDVTTADLLGRAVLYKVGHHGSHNATLRAKGLELMTSDRLVAMIPTVQAVALEQGSKGWLMPNPETYKGLIRQTKGRILRGDLNTNDGTVRAEIEKLIESDPEFEGFALEDIAPALTETDLYVDYTVMP
ncbi:MAG: hypothetical protein ABIT04_04020 [Novosphingobium sp.]